MLSSRSDSLASPEPPSRRALRHEWPRLVVLPALVALIGTAVAAPLVEMFLGPHFGLSGGREAPWPWSLVIIACLGFWAAIALESTKLSREASTATLMVLGLAVIVGWWALDPVWDVRPLLRDPVSLVGDNGHFVVPLMVGIGFWVQGLRLAFEPALMGAEAIRERVRFAIVALGLAMALAGLIGGDMGEAGISTAIVALPVLLVSSAAAIAAAEMASTRRLAARRHTTAPGWDRWARTSGGAALFLLVVVGIGALFLGPGALQLVVDGMAALWHGIATVLLWIVYGIVYVIYYVYRFVAWIINSIFGDVVRPMELPEMGGQMAPPEEEVLPPEVVESEPNLVLRWIALGLALVIVALIVFFMARRRASVDGDGDIEEERSSIFSAALARKQLRDLFRRKPRPERPRRLDLERDPESVREVMLYLQVLASRQGYGRETSETPRDFAGRLAAEWPGLREPLDIVRGRYERVRYGETEEDRREAVQAWRQIHDARRDAPPKPSGEDRHGGLSGRQREAMSDARIADASRKTVML